ncbi:MAG: Multidrug resistance protein MdtG [candidate division WS2 bacterium]|nr:Multidrug resistance protein MdtG [Candidatus Lithacetigena glycinireducens]
MHKNKNVEILSLTAFFVLVSLFSWVYLLPLHLKELGASDRQIGFSYTLFILSFTIFQFMGGFLVDRFGRKTMIVIPGYFYPPLYLLMALSRNWFMVTLCFFFVNMASSFQTPAFFPFVAESSENRERAFALFNASASFGVGVGTLTGSFIIKPIGIQNMMIITACIYLFAATLRHFFLKETRHKITSMDNNSFPEKISLPPFNTALLSFLIIASLISLSISLTVNGPFITLYLKEALFKTKEQINLLYASGWITASLLSFIGGNLAKNYGAHKILGLSVLLHPLFLILYFLPFNYPFPTIFLFLISFIFFQLIAIAQPLVLTSLTRIEERGRITGLFGAVTGLFSSVGPTVGTELKIAFGGLSPFILAQIWGILALIAFIIHRIRRKRLFTRQK